jgi:hypothetical protein
MVLPEGRISSVILALHMLHAPECYHSDPTTQEIPLLLLTETPGQYPDPEHVKHGEWDGSQDEADVPVGQMDDAMVRVEPKAAGIKRIRTSGNVQYRLVMQHLP